jgi:putative iron-dependent peroxidase
VGDVAQKVWRRSVPWGGVANNGLYFVGFACELSRLEIQLQRMYGLTEDGISDRLTEFSSAIRSSWWYVPSDETIKGLI